MRVLHVIVHLSAGGAERMLQRLVCSHRSDPGFEHRVISLRGLGTVGPELEKCGIAVEALGLNSPMGLPSVLVRLVRRIKRYDPDIVQTWMYHADLIGGLAARVAGCRRLIWGVRIAEIAPEFGVSRVTGGIRSLCARLSSWLPSRIVYVAESARRSHEAAGYDPGKSVVIHNGYDIPAVPRTPGTHALRSELGLGTDELLIGTGGRYNRQKNYRSFVAACAEVARHEPGAHFVMFGNGVDGRNRELCQWIDETGLAQRFHLMGERRDFVQCLPGLDVFCLHSLSEGFPNVVAEAMAAGVPCVVTDVGDAAALVAETGTVVPPTNDAALATALVDMLRLDPSRRLAYGRLARSRIEGNFSMNSIQLQYEQLYLSLCGRCRPAGAGMGGEPAAAANSPKLGTR